MLELDEDFDPDARALCPDGSCTGVLDERGICKVCGAQGEPATGAPAREAPVGEPADEATAAAAAGDDDDEEIESRQLCPDGACIGVIGPDGRCKVCGRTLS